MITIEKLVRFINLHDPCVARALEDGTIEASTEVVNLNTREVFRETNVLPADLQAVRDWLGY